MNFKTKLDQYGDIRTKSWFALLPVTIDDGEYEETKWLEKVTVKQVYCKIHNYMNGWHEGWKNVVFVEKEDT